MWVIQKQANTNLEQLNRSHSQRTEEKGLRQFSHEVIISNKVKFYVNFLKSTTFQMSLQNLQIAVWMTQTTGFQIIVC